MKKDLKLNIQMFANPTLTNGGTHEMKESYATEIIRIVRIENKLRSRANKQYEGDLKSGAVKVPVRLTDVEVQDYEIATGCPLTQSATTYETFICDNDHAVNELIDGYEAQVVPDNIKAQRTESAGYAMGKKTETTYIDKLIEKGTQFDETLTADNVYTAINKSVGVLSKLGIKKSEILIAITVEAETLLLEDKRFTNTASQIGAERVLEGVVGKIRGAEVITVEDLDDDAVNYICYAPEFTIAADVFKVDPTIETLPRPYIGASSLAGRAATLSDVTRPKYVLVSTIASASA